VEVVAGSRGKSRQRSSSSSSNDQIKP
jgi:hypothetical protein